MAMRMTVLLCALPFLGAAADLELKLEPPNLVGASNDSQTHYWFPTDMAVVFNASHFLVGARLADDCSDYFCNATGHHVSPCKPSDPSHQISLTTDGGRSFVPLWEVGGTSPWSSGLQARPFLGPCTLRLNSTAQLSIYQGKTWAPWESVAVVYAMDPSSGLRWRLSEQPVRYEGAETVCSTGHLWGQNIIESPDTSGLHWLLSAQCDVNLMPPGQPERKGAKALIFGSDDGHVWNLLSAVLVVAADDAPSCASPGENTIVSLSDGRLLLVARCGGGQQLLGWVSSDAGRTWQRHVLPRNMIGVMPVAVRMDNGAIVLVTGRGGQALWLNANGDGQEWVLTNLAQSHNELVLQNSKLNGTSLLYTDAFVHFNETGESSSYNTLRKLGANDGIVCYDRKSQSSALPGEYSCAPPGNLDQNDHVFCMRFHVGVTAQT